MKIIRKLSVKASIYHWPFQNTLVLSSGVLLLLLWLNCQTIMLGFGAKFRILTVTTATDFFYFILGWLLVFIIWLFKAKFSYLIDLMGNVGKCTVYCVLTCPLLWSIASIFFQMLCCKILSLLLMWYRCSLFLSFK